MLFDSLFISADLFHRPPLLALVARLFWLVSN